MPSGVDPSTAPIEAVFTGVVDGVGYVTLPNLPKRQTPVEGLAGAPTPDVDEKVLVTYADTGRLWLVRGGDHFTQAEHDLERALDIGLYAVLPPTPYDGQVIRFQNAMLAAQNVVWTMRFKTGSGWSFVGGGEWSSADFPNRAAFNTAALATFVDMANPVGTPPAFVAPWTGNFFFISQIVVAISAGGFFEAGTGQNGAIAGLNRARCGGTSAAQYTLGFRGGLGLAAGDTVTLMGSTNNIACNLAFARTRLFALPMTG